MRMLELRQVSRSYGQGTAEVHALREVSLSADEGAMVAVNSEALMRLLHDACQDAGMTAMVVTHDARLASWADRVVFLRDGQVTDQSAPAPGPEFLLGPGSTR